MILPNSKMHTFFTCGWTQLDFQPPWCAHCLVHVTTFKSIGGTLEDTPSSFHLLDAFPPFWGDLYETKLTGYSGRPISTCKSHKCLQSHGLLYKSHSFSKNQWSTWEAQHIGGSPQGWDELRFPVGHGNCQQSPS